MMKVRDLMSREVVTVSPTTPIKDVARLLVDHGISGMPVVDDGGRVVGVISEADFVIKERGADSIERRPLHRIIGDSEATRAQLAKVMALRAGDAMTSPAVTIGADALVSEAASTMARQRVNRLPVLAGDALVGVVTRADIVRGFARSDEDVVQAIRGDVLRQMLWLDPALFQVESTDGNVRIGGVVERRSEAEMLERITAIVPGVTSVSSDVTWSLDDRDIKAPAPDMISRYRS